MTGFIDIVCNIYTPEAVANGWTGLDDDFKRQVRMPPHMFGGVTTDDYLRKMDRAGIERSLLIAVRAGDLNVRGSWEIPYSVIAGFHALTLRDRASRRRRARPRQGRDLHGHKDAQLRRTRHARGKLRDAAIGWSMKFGDVAAIVARNCPEFIEVVAGIPDAGAIVATIDPRLSAPEVRRVLADCGATLIFADAEAVALVEATGLTGRRSSGSVPLTRRFWLAHSTA